uniref:Uncharacterized protein n=1 Tax=Amphimedon queenslandica TaxID=400682 RepID=A0A1X7SG53_AMPQE
IQRCSQAIQKKKNKLNKK